MKRKSLRFMLLFGPILVGLTTITAWQAPSVLNTDSQWMSAVDHALLDQLNEQSQIEFIIYMKEQADISAAKELKSKSEKGAFIFKELTTLANETQRPILSELRRQGASFQSFWISNMIWVKGDPQIIQNMASRKEVGFIYSNPKISLQSPMRQNGLQLSNQLSEQLWNLELIRAPDVWQIGYDGTGIVIGGQDTGYDWQHQALIEQYRGWDGNAANHNYNWHDAIHDGNPLCGADSSIPCDGHGHGTHTMGTMIGDDGQGTILGVAPGAKWIGCRNMNDSGQGTPATYIECYQWFFAPTDVNNENPDWAAAPDIINNSWSCPISEGCLEPDILEQVVDIVREAGILTVHSAGNSGPDCDTVNTPAAIYDASFTVGATTEQDVIWDRSSLGPVSVDNSLRLKPDISAPGHQIYSSWPNDTYATLSGTSMAGPHVAGTAALLMEAEPTVIGEPDKAESILAQSAIPKLATQNCGDIGLEQIPNNTYGYGRVDAFSAVLAAMGHKVYIPFLAPN